MITRVELDNFKRFRHLDVELRALTVLAGLNGAGKSTLIQALLLVRQATESADRSVVALNDAHGLALGEAWEVLHPQAAEPCIGIRLCFGGQVCGFRFEVPDERSLNLPITQRPHVLPGMLTTSNGQFTYLNAERLGPRDQLAVDPEDMREVVVGERGQYTAQVLAARETQQVPERMLHPDTENHNAVTTLRTQVELWASDIIRPIKISAEWIPGLSASVIRFQEEGILGETIRPGNTGFGLSYALPILVAGLSMRSGGLFIVENPEAHLHPAGQSKMGRFLGRLAGNNVQVLVETHSDHIINGIRAAVAEEKTIDHDDVIFNFFGSSVDDAVEAIDISQHGSPSSWPAGFFDQIQVDLGRLAHAAKRNR